MNNEKILVLGLGATGLSMIRHCQGQVWGVMDDRVAPPGRAALQAEYPDIMLHLGDYDADILAQADKFFVSPSISRQHPLIAPLLTARPADFLSDIDLFFQSVKDVPVIGVTGTNGKSTVVSLLGHIADYLEIKTSVGGNLGPPALDIIDPDNQLYVLELSSFQLAWSKVMPLKAGVVLNMTADHLDWHSTILDYFDAKQRLYAKCQDPVAFLPDCQNDEAITFGYDNPEPGHFGLLELDGQDWLAYGRQPLLPSSKLQLQGRHQLGNVLAALALGKQLQWPLAKMVAALPSFTGLAHRYQRIGERNGVVWVNDSKATNVMAACAAIESASELAKTGKVVLIAGGQSKEDNFMPLALLARQSLRAARVFGQDAEKLHTPLGEHCVIVESLTEAVRQADEIAETGDVVLLAPACASFDQFDNYQHRGEVFISAFEAL